MPDITCQPLVNDPEVKLAAAWAITVIDITDATSRLIQPQEGNCMVSQDEEHTEAPQSDETGCDNGS